MATRRQRDAPPAGPSAGGISAAAGPLGEAYQEQLFAEIRAGGEQAPCAGPGWHPDEASLCIESIDGRRVHVDDGVPVALQLSFWDPRAGPVTVLVAGPKPFLDRIDDDAIDESTRWMDNVVPGDPLVLCKDDSTRLMRKFMISCDSVRGKHAQFMLTTYHGGDTALVTGDMDSMAEVAIESVWESEPGLVEELLAPPADLQAMQWLRSILVLRATMAAIATASPGGEETSDEEMYIAMEDERAPALPIETGVAPAPVLEGEREPPGGQEDAPGAAGDDDWFTALVVEGVRQAERERAAPCTPGPGDAMDAIEVVPAAPPAKAVAPRLAAPAMDAPKKARKDAGPVEAAFSRAGFKILPAGREDAGVAVARFDLGERGALLAVVPFDPVLKGQGEISQDASGLFVSGVRVATKAPRLSREEVAAIAGAAAPDLLVTCYCGKNIAYQDERQRPVKVLQLPALVARGPVHVDGKDAGVAWVRPRKVEEFEDIIPSKGAAAGGTAPGVVPGHFVVALDKVPRLREMLVAAASTEGALVLDAEHGALQEASRLHGTYLKTARPLAIATIATAASLLVAWFALVPGPHAPTMAWSHYLVEAVLGLLVAAMVYSIVRLRRDVAGLVDRRLRAGDPDSPFQLAASGDSPLEVASGHGEVVFHAFSRAFLPPAEWADIDKMARPALADAEERAKKARDARLGLLAMDAGQGSNAPGDEKTSIDAITTAFASTEIDLGDRLDLDDDDGDPPVRKEVPLAPAGKKDVMRFDFTA